MELKRRRAPGRLLGVALGLCAMGLGITACSSNRSAPPVASIPHSRTHPPSPKATGQPSEATLFADFGRFASCMRRHGVSVRDPKEQAGKSALMLALPQGQLTAGVQSAMNTCSHFLPPDLISSSGQSPQEQRLASELPKLVEYAQCMRAHDIAMLDPPASGAAEGQLNLGHVPGITSGFGRYTPQFRTADGLCRHLLPAGVVDDGTGP